MEVRTIKLDDLYLRVNWMNNPKVHSTMHFSVPINIDETEEWFKRNRESKKRVDLIFSQDNLPVGMGGLTSIDYDIKQAELYLFINPELHGKGFGTKSIYKLCEYGFEVLNLNRIYLEVDELNYIARRLYEKCNFTLEGILRQTAKRDGKLINRCVYSYLKKEYDN